MTTKALTVLVALAGSAYATVTGEFGWAIWVLLAAALFDLLYALGYHEEVQLRHTLMKIASAVAVPAAVTWFAAHTAHAPAANTHQLAIATTSLAALAMLRSAIPHAGIVLKRFLKLAGVPAGEAKTIEGDIAAELAKISALLTQRAGQGDQQP